MTKNQRGTPERGGSFARSGELRRHLSEAVRRAFIEFLTIPTLVIVGFLLLAVIMFFLDASRIANENSELKDIWRGLFSDAQAARDFLGVIAASIITVTSITFSLLLIAVQQGASALTSLVFDQFLRRRTNQLYFGFFIGLALYALIALASVNPSHQPIYGVATAGLMTIVALYMLILLIYNTVDQMRPVVIIQSIHDHALRARGCQLGLLRQTRRAPRRHGAPSACVTADRSGFLAWLDVPALAKAMAATDAEIVIVVSIGDYVAVGDLIAEIRAAPEHDSPPWEPLIREAVALEEQRDLDTDAAFGIEQLAVIGWTSISTAKSNPGPGLLTIWNLRDLLARWLQTDAAFGTGGHDTADPAAPVVYFDNLPQQVMLAFESLAVVASESMQHQSAAEVYRTFASLFPRLPAPLRQQADDLLLRSLSGLGDHVMTSDLDAALAALVDALTAAGHSKCGDAVAAARHRLELSIGRLNSRSTRADSETSN